jgi:arylsulfatase A-like enzyme
MCSPTRAALLTGVNPHRAGAGHVANSDPGFPGYASELADDVATAAELFRDAGYQTMAIGKWHLTKDSDLSDAGPRHSWPLQKGFDRYYGVLDAFSNLHHPHRLVEDNHTVETDQYPDGYYLTDDLTDRAISMIRHAKASNPRQPFFCYFAHIAVHAPLQCRDDDLAAQRGRYDAGWDAIRAERHRRQIELGVLPPGTPLPPRNEEEGDDVAPWDEPRPRRPGPVRPLHGGVRRHGRGGRPLGGPADGGARGAGRGRRHHRGVPLRQRRVARGRGAGHHRLLRTLVSKNVKDMEDAQLDRANLDLAGGPRTLVHYPRGWAMASNTPFRLYKINTHAGGHTVPFLWRWPNGPAASGRRDQWAHITDCCPRSASSRASRSPTSATASPWFPSMARAWSPCSPMPPRRTIEAGSTWRTPGHRAFVEDGWEIVTRHVGLTPFGDHEWELYDLTTDRTETTDLAAQQPAKVAELAAKWEAEAQRNQVYPLDEGSRVRYVIRPPYEEPFHDPVRIVAGTYTLERYRSQLLIQWRNVDIDVELDFATGDRGVLVAHGDQGGGYHLRVDDDDRLVFCHNGYGVIRELDAGVVPDGCKRIRVEVQAPGGWLWNVRVLVGDDDRGTLTDLPMLGAMAPFEGIDVGIDRRSPVSWEVHERHGTYPWSGQLNAVTYTPGERAPDAGTNFIELLREMGLRYE